VRRRSPETSRAGTGRTLTARDLGVYESRHVKPRATSLLLLVLFSLSGRVALAHPDTLGEADPYWQQRASAARDGSADATPGNTPAGQPAAASRLLKGFAYASGGVSLLFVLSLLRSIRGSLRRARA
jgi:hypothetical protein